MKYQFEWAAEIKCCADCPINGFLENGIDTQCLIYYREVEDISIKPDWCPLVEVESEGDNGKTD